MLTSLSTEDLIPKDHPIRKIRRIVDEVLAELDGEFDAMYSRIGRPSVEVASPVDPCDATPRRDGFTRDRGSPSLCIDRDDVGRVDQRYASLASLSGGAAPGPAQPASGVALK